MANNKDLRAEGRGNDLKDEQLEIKVRREQHKRLSCVTTQKLTILLAIICLRNSRGRGKADGQAGVGEQLPIYLLLTMNTGTFSVARNLRRNRRNQACSY